jgi:hypothetical protein
MVTRRRGPPRGVSTLGCLFSLLLVAVVFYYGIDIGRVYWNYYKLLDQMKVSARFAQTQNDEQILRTLRGAVDELGLPEEAKRFVIRRTEAPRRIRIQTQYTVQLELPFTVRILNMKPEVEASLSTF